MRSSLLRVNAALHYDCLLVGGIIRNRYNGSFSEGSYIKIAQWLSILWVQQDLKL